MSQGYSRLLGTFAVLTLGCIARTQGLGWGSECFDPQNKTPISPGSSWFDDGNDVMQVALGISGTVTYGGTVSSTDPHPGCFVPAITANFAGRIGFGAGVNGSTQSAFDDGMSYTFGFPYPAGTWGYATLTTDSPNLDGNPAKSRTLFGSTGFTVAFQGASDRYVACTELLGSAQIDLRIDILGDTARFNWTFTNTDTMASHTFGLWVGCSTAMENGQGAESGMSFGIGANNETSSKTQFVSVPGVIPPTVEQRYIRATNPSGFPSFVNFDFGQTQAYGLRCENGPNPDTEDSTGFNSDITQADEFALGQGFFLLGFPNAGDLTFPDFMFGPKLPNGETDGGDITYIEDPAFIQKYNEQPVAPGSNRVIVQYFRSTWASANYFRPYSVVVDAPQLMPTDITTSTGIAAFSGPNAPASGAYPIKVIVDNTRGFSQADKSIELDNVNVTLTLPNGLNLASGQTATKVIPKVLPASPILDSVTFFVIPDGVAYGQLHYTVTVSPTPGPVKVITGTINVASTPKLTISQGPNLVGTPWTFSDNSWESVLGLIQGTDFQAYAWDPVQNGYILATTATRGVGYWLVATNQIGLRALQSNPQTPTDTAVGAGNQLLQAGWNLISNPYPYGIPVGQIIGATNANPNQDFGWSELVSQGFVNGAIGYYNTTTGSYNYLQNGTDLLQPNVGYWIFVGVSQPLTIKFPAVFTEFLPNSTRSVASPWTQTDSAWRLQLGVRQGKVVDANNYIGRVATPALVKSLQIQKPPAMPAKFAGVSLAIQGQVNGKTTRMAQALTTGGTRTTYTVTVTTPTAGDVTLTWPNMSTIPKTVQARLVDTANGNSRVMNQSSGYTFTAAAGATRTFQVQLQPQTPGRATIGNVIVQRTSRATNAPVAIQYTLGVAATTSITILNGAGNTISTIVSGRADTTGPNSAVWNLKDNANRSVAPGTYRIVIQSSTPDGSTDRRTQTVNITR